MAISLDTLAVVITIISVLAMDFYGFYVLRKAQKEIDGVTNTRLEIDEKINFISSAYSELHSQVSDAVTQAQEMLTPQMGVEMGEAIILSSLQSLGMKNLKELGEKGRTVSNAKIGLQIVGNEIAKGAGVNEILEQFSPHIERLQQGAGMMDAFSDNPMFQLVSSFMGGGGGNQEINVTPNNGRQLPRELRK